MGEEGRIDVFWHNGMLAHNVGRGVDDTLMDPGFLAVLDEHPEGAERIINILSILRKGPVAAHVRWHEGSPAHVDDLRSFHSQEYIKELIAADKAGGKIFAGGTQLNPGSWNACLLAAGSSLLAMQHIVEGRGKLGYALVRPPGHHAQPSQADGYCFLNNAGLATQLALDMGCKRVVVVDVDVHYGNGTAQGFYDRKDVFTISLHMNHGSWGETHPQTGQPDECGEGEGIGFNMNIPLPNGTGDKGYEYAMKNLVVPAITEYKPDMMVLTFGQDASAFDPGGRQCLTMAGYRLLGQILREQADIHTGGRMLLVQEGGYHRTYSAYCAHAMVEGILQLPEPLLCDPMAYYIEDAAPAIKATDEIRNVFVNAIAAAKSKLFVS